MAQKIMTTCTNCKNSFEPDVANPDAVIYRANDPNGDRLVDVRVVCPVCGKKLTIEVPGEMVNKK